jgi:hypothetical protein
MPDPCAKQIVDTALALRQTHPGATALEILDLTMKGHERSDPDFSVVGQPWDDDSQPPSPFAELLRAALAPAMPAQSITEFALMTDEQRNVFADQWAAAVIQPFASRYRLWEH